ncbi:MAG: TIR domain-containing protein [Chloroflexota bacterium]
MSHIFISYARKDHFFVDRLREDLERNQVKYWIDREGLSPGTASWERAIRKALQTCHSVLWIVSQASFESPYVRDEISIARLYTRKIYPVFADGEHWLECVPIGTGEIQYIDARTNYSVALDTILAEIDVPKSDYRVPEVEIPTLPTGTDPRNPYKGLSAFTANDADDFYGRESLVKKLSTRIEQKISDSTDRFLAVLGPSGAGKSSVVMAGLLPALQKAHADWHILPKIVPSTHPVEALADALYSAMPEKSLSAIEQDLNSAGGRMLHRLARQVDSPQVVLYIDQFEELFTLTADENERQQFIDLITQAASEPDGKVIVILSMRADFYGHPANYPALGKLVNQNSELVLPMTITELRDAIEKPARLSDVALTFDTGLVAEIIFALRERDKALAGALPLLQFTLERLFAERDGTHLTWNAYNALGNSEKGISGVEGAIGTHCEDVFQQLPADAQSKLGQVFLPLVSIDETTGEATRRRATLERITSDDDAQTFVNLFIENRLLQTGRDNDDTVYVEITHEALFRSWERLMTWIEDTKGDLTLFRQYERDAHRWNERERNAPLPSHEVLVYFYSTIENLNINREELPEPLLSYTVPEANRLLKELNKLPPLPDNEPRRRDIGDRLGVIGDPREGVGLKNGLPNIKWLPVVGSKDTRFAMRNDTNTFYWGAFHIEDFFIAKFLITYEQYQTFVNAKDGYKLEDWWYGFPSGYQPQKLGEQRSKSVNNPRDTISWYQSVAFGRWMTAKFDGLDLGFPSGTHLRVGDNAEIRIPTEWEWQWAAMNGTDERVYPWGTWQAGYANTSVSGLARAIAVGMYPHGKAECGALDMSGNLYEWCMKYQEKTGDINTNTTDVGVLRGCSFNGDYEYASTMSRRHTVPYDDIFSRGIRLVIAPKLDIS